MIDCTDNEAAEERKKFRSGSQEIEYCELFNENNQLLLNQIKLEKLS